VNNLEKEISDLDMKVNELTFMRREDLNRLSSLEAEINNLESEVSMTGVVSQLFKHLLDTLLDKKKQDIENLGTYGLKSVFTDLDLKLHMKIELAARGISTSFELEEVGVAQGDVMSCFGGGITNIVSFILRIITIFQTKLAPYLFLDECFSNLSEGYVENCSLLLKNLCKKLRLTLFVVTHEEGMINYADNVYKTSSRNNRLRIEKVSGKN